MEAGSLLAETWVQGDTALIADGYFFSRPSIQLQELRWLRSLGVNVIGVSSIGALRAADLHDVGIAGSGYVFNAYASGETNDDAEVALLHSPDPPYMPFTLPLINFRYALKWNVKIADVISPEIRSVIWEVAKAISFRERTWAAIYAALPGKLIAAHEGVEYLECLDVENRDVFNVKALDLTLALLSDATTADLCSSTPFYSTSDFAALAVDPILRSASNGSFLDMYRMTQLGLNSAQAESGLQQSPLAHVAMNYDLRNLSASLGWSLDDGPLPEQASASAAEWRKLLGPEWRYRLRRTPIKGEKERTQRIITSQVADHEESTAVRRRGFANFSEAALTVRRFWWNLPKEFK